MPNLCFKARKGSRTVQVVRHAYSPEVKRSRTVTLGSVPLDADPDDFEDVLYLRPGIELNNEDLLLISAWLVMHGDAAAARRRRRQAERIAARVRAEVHAELTRQSGNALERAVKALDDAASALPALAEQARNAGENVWKSLRPGYLAVHGAWERFMKTAQASGSAKRRQAGRKPPAPASTKG